MAFDPSFFHHPAIVDTCAIWNLLSSRALFESARRKVHFCVTPMVHFECVVKPRKNMTTEQAELISRYRIAVAAGTFPVQSCELADLVAISRLASSALSSGELSCIAAAYKIRSVSFMTDEKKARKFAESLNLGVETTPRLYGWLHYHYHLADHDHAPIIAEHERFERRPLTKYFNESYELALQARAYSRSIPPKP